MQTNPILVYLKKHGQQLESEIAAGMGMPLTDVRDSLIDLSAKGEISRCSVTRFHNGEPIDGMLCRVVGYVPPKTPGRKPGAKS